jgi:SET domain-containing protein
MKTRRRLPSIKANLIKNKLVTIKKSKIEGLGVFALVDIPMGTKIADYYGKEMTLKNFKQKYGEYKNNSLNTYRMKRINRIIVAKIEPYKSRNLTNYINESKNPNCILKKRALYTLNNIKKGEELTLQYPEDYNRNYTLKNNN